MREGFFVAPIKSDFFFFFEQASTSNARLCTQQDIFQGTNWLSFPRFSWSSLEFPSRPVCLFNLVLRLSSAASQDKVAREGDGLSPCIHFQRLKPTICNKTCSSLGDFPVEGMPLTTHINSLDRKEKRLLVLSGCARKHRRHYSESASDGTMKWFWIQLYRSLGFCVVVQWSTQEFAQKMFCILVFKRFCKAGMDFSESGWELGQGRAETFHFVLSEFNYRHHLQWWRSCFGKIF